MEKFTKLRNVGKGNMGACALVRNNEDNKCYVIKQIDLTRMNKKEREQSLNEARLLSSLRHPNIIHYVDSFLSRKSDHLCIVMEYADNGDLSTRIKKTYGINFRETQVIDWVIQMTLSLSYIHNRKILHRDIKAQNVFLTNQNIVKIGDFGIARTLCGTYEQAKTFVGTPYYLSPELILERPYDHRSDVWALGVIIYELMALKHPFNATSMKGLMQRILKVQYEPLPKLYSTELRNIIPRLLTKEPSQRMKLEELLEIPIIQRRLRQWMLTDVMPKNYIEALLSHDLLPSSIAALRKYDVGNSNFHHQLPSLVQLGGAAMKMNSAHGHVVGALQVSPEQHEKPLQPLPQRHARSVEQSQLEEQGQNHVEQRKFVTPKNPSELQAQKRLRPVYLMYKKINGGYNSPPVSVMVPRKNNIQEQSGLTPSLRAGVAPGSHASQESPRAHVDPVDAAAVPASSAFNDRKQPNGCIVDSFFSLRQPNLNPPENNGGNPYSDHCAFKRNQQVSGGVAMCLNPFFQSPQNGFSQLPCFTGASNIDIKAMLQRAALERAQRRAFS